MNENLTEMRTDLSSRGEGLPSTLPKVSVIVPVYKVEKYLPECIESVLAQTFTDFELILVDDGSPDNSGKICDDYAARDSRIRVFHKENGGVSSARNLGLDNARGEWIAFVDSDDWVESDKFSEFLECVDTVDSSIDIVVGAMVGKMNRIKVGGLTITEFVQQGGFTCLSVWLAGFRRNIIIEKNLQFLLGIKYAEDRSWVLKYLFHSRRVLNTGIAFYNYRPVECSSMHTIDVNLMKFFHDHCVVTDDLLEYRESFPNVSPIIGAQIFCFVMPLFYKIFKSNRVGKRIVQNWIRKTTFRSEDFKFISFPRRMLWGLAKISILLPGWYYSAKVERGATFCFFSKN